MASITGTVTDPSGSAVPGATVELKNVNTNDIRRATSNAAGSFEFANVLPGTCELAVATTGLTTCRRTGLVVQTGTNASVTAAVRNRTRCS